MGLNLLDKDILRLSIPAIVSNITVPLLGLCDTAISGHLGSELFLAAIAVGSVMLNVVFWLFGFLRMGTTGITANAFGAGDSNEVRKVFTRSVLLGLTGGILLILFQVPVYSALSRLIGVDAEISSSVTSYFVIRIWGAPALLAVMAVSGWFVGMQNTVYPMVIAISVNIINILMSFILVFGMDMGFDGVATGTLISNWAGLLIAFICCLKFTKGKRLWCKFGDIFHGGIQKFFTVNINLFFRSFFIICVTLGVTAAGSRLGALTLAVNVIIMQFFQFFSFFMDGFAFSAEALIGKRFGERDFSRLSICLKRLLLWTFGVTAFFTLIYGFGSEGIVKILTDSRSVRIAVEGMRLWIILIPLVSSWAFIFDGCFIGITDTSKMMFSTLIASIVFFLIVFVKVSEGKIGINVENNNYIWIGFLSYLFIRGLFLAIIWRPTLRAKFRSY